MDVTRMKEILKKEYGICTENELNMAVSGSEGINLGIFTLPLTERSAGRERENKLATA